MANPGPARSREADTPLPERSGVRGRPGGHRDAGARPRRRTSGPASRKRKRRRRTGEQILRVAVVFVALTLVGAEQRLRLPPSPAGQIHTIKCKACAAVADGTPYNVLIVGSDTRAGNSGGAAQAFGSASLVGGQRSDTIKILHVDPAAGTARLLSIPRDTYVTLSGMPATSGLATDNKINAAFNYGPDPLIATIENTFGIPISHFVIIDFTGVINLVNSVNGITLNFPYPVRDDDNGNNNSGLVITHRRLPDPQREHGPGPGPVALLPVRGPARLLGGRRQRRPRADPASERHHRGDHRQGQVELRPAHPQRLPRFGGPRRHRRPEHVGDRPSGPGPEIPRLLRLQPADRHPARPPAVLADGRRRRGGAGAGRPRR